ncbi:trigger factor [[Clostridium] symbiosum]|uniref:trigger factor n=1 Tax=Clostridium symbiosum TaxID=1512 RepID=UPI00232E6C79|nr:trigger factor [[Clostridium] symbiosum]MDB2010694.1 trigger factor [[Clostridium] symbiosum]MDB2028112.1 trigger factor [[Clostridium] symbiosum]
MRKFLKVGLCGAAALMMFATGCSGQKSAKDASQAESTAEGETPAETEEYVAEGSITLGEYKGIPVTVTETTVTDEEVDAQIQQLLNSSAEYLEVDREAQLGDQVNIDYKGMKDGVAFDGGTAEGYDLVLGSNSFIDGFESGLVGAKKGEEVTLNLTFPDPYQNNPDLAGQAVVFEVKVNNVKEKTVPELTDDFVAKVSPEDGTVEKLRENMKAFILEQKQYQIDNQRNTDILNAIIDKSEIVCATDDVDKNYETQVQYYTNQASMYGLDLATYASLMGMDEEGLKSELRNVARDMTKQEMLLKEIASRENITVTDEDREALAERYGYDSLESFLETADKEIVDDTALMQKTLDFLVENAEITVAKGDVAPAS